MCNKGTLCSFALPQNAILLVNSKQTLYGEQVIAEIKKEETLLLEKDQKNIYSKTSGEIFFINNYVFNFVCKINFKYL